MNYRQKLLLVAAIALLPAGLAYGAMPQMSMQLLFGIDVSDVNTTHIFRVIMCIYLSQAAFWAVGAFVSRLTEPALYSLIVFMAGVGLGRALSLTVDGTPNWLMIVFLVVEVVFVVAGIIVLIKPAEKAVVTIADNHTGGLTERVIDSATDINSPMGSGKITGTSGAAE